MAWSWGDVRIIPAQFVKPYVKSNKNDLIDAAAIAEAVTRPTMRFAQIKQREQVDLQALHRSRELLVSTRTRMVNQMRAFCLEFDVALRPGTGAFKASLPVVLADEANDLTPSIRQLLAELSRDLAVIEARIDEFSTQISAAAARSDAARRLTSVPGIGPLTATALVAAVGNGRQFRTARDLAAWIGLTPAEHSTGGKDAPSGDQQKRQQLSAPIADPRVSIVRHAHGSNERQAGRLDLQLAGAASPEQGCCRTGKQDRANRLGF